MGKNGFHEFPSQIIKLEFTDVAQPSVLFLRVLS